MASLVDSIRSVYQDNYSLLKLGIFSYFIFLLLGINLKTNSFNLLNFLVWVVVYYVYLGFSCLIMHNRIKQDIKTLPSFNPVIFNAVSLKAFIISIPYLLIAYFVVNMAVGLFSFEGVPQLVSLWIIRFLVFSFLITALILYSNNFDIRDGINLSKTIPHVADVLVYTLLGAILLIILGAFIVAPTLILIYNTLGLGSIFKYVAVFFATMNIAFISDYWGQMHYDMESKNNFY